MSCPYANLLGEPGKGIHGIRLGGVALVDLLLTIGIAVGLSYIPGSPPLTLWIVWLILLAMLLHSIFCTRTSVNEWVYKSNVTLVVFVAVPVVALVAVAILKIRNKF